MVFSTPEVGIAGLTESEARAAGHKVGIARYDYRTDARAQVSGHPEGMLKIVYDDATRAVLGVHILAADAAPLLGEGTLAVSAHVPMEALAMAIHAHPTLSELMGIAAREALAPRH